MLATKYSITGLCFQMTDMSPLKNLISRNYAKDYFLNVHICKWEKTPNNLYFMDNQIMNIQSILIICRFCICKFGYSLKFICNPQIITHGASLVTCQHAQSSEKSESPKGMFPTVVEQGDTLPSSFQLPYCQQVSFL